MERKLQVFISSTFEDLKRERQEVVESVLNADHIPAGMELFKAGPTQEAIITEWIENSDVYVLILGPRYGSMKEGTDISYTQWEYELAKKLDKPMFSIVLTDDYINQMVKDDVISAKDWDNSNPKYENFKTLVSSNLYSPINNILEIRGKVADNLRDIEKRYKDKLVGWVNGTFLDELKELRTKNKELTEKVINRQEDVIEMKEELGRLTESDSIGEYNYEALKEILMLTKMTIGINDPVSCLEMFLEIDDDYILAAKEPETEQEFDLLRELQKYDLIETDIDHGSGEIVFSATNEGKKMYNRLKFEQLRGELDFD